MPEVMGVAFLPTSEFCGLMISCEMGKIWHNSGFFDKNGVRLGLNGDLSLEKAENLAKKIEERDMIVVLPEHESLHSFLEKYPKGVDRKDDFGAPGATYVANNCEAIIVQEAIYVVDAMFGGKACSGKYLTDWMRERLVAGASKWVGIFLINREEALHLVLDGIRPLRRPPIWKIPMVTPSALLGQTLIQISGSLPRAKKKKSV